MKKILLGLIMMVLTVSLFSQQLTYRFANEQLTNGGLTMEFDVELMCDVPGIFLAEHTVSFVYNTVGFGENIVPTNVVVTKGTLMTGEFSGIQFYDLAGVANTFPNTMSASCLTNWGAGAPSSMFFNEAPLVFTDFMHFAITVADPGELAGIVFTEFLMNGQQYYQLAAATVALCADPNFYDNDLLTFPLGAGGVVTDWIGGTSIDWTDPLNWTNGVPTGDPTEEVNIDATITKATFAPTISGSVTTGILNLIAGTLSIAPGGDLTTTGLFTNNGLLYMSSDAAGVSASYIDGAGTAGGGNYQFDRDVFASGAVPYSYNSFGWHYLSSPVAGFDTDDLPDYFVNAWSETAGSWIQYAMDPVINPCTPYPTTPMTAMDAWSVNWDMTYPGPCTTLAPPTGNMVEMMGTSLNALAQSVPATFTANPDPDVEGWNLYGNPYASSIDPSLINWTGFDNTALHGAAMYDGLAGNYIYSNSANLYPYFIGPTQGFFLKALATGTFALTGAERAHAAGQVIYKDDVTGLLTLEAAGDETSDLTWIRFMDGTEAGMDVNDFPKLFSTTEDLAQIYTTAQGEDLAVNALPATPVVPMGFTSVTTGEYTISAIETSEFADVVLEDRVTGEQTDLLTSSYTFNYTVNDDADRFLVHFTPLGIGDNLANSIDIWSNDHKIYVQAPEIKGDIVVFNMMGQEVIRTEIEPGLNTIPVDNRNSYYIVKVISSDVARTGKVYVK